MLYICIILFLFMLKANIYFSILLVLSLAGVDICLYINKLTPINGIFHIIFFLFWLLFLIAFGLLKFKSLNRSFSWVPFFRVGWVLFVTHLVFVFITNALTHLLEFEKSFVFFLSLFLLNLIPFLPFVLWQKSD